MMRLENTEVRLWFVFCREIQDEALLARYRTLLSEVERQQERRFYFPQDRHRYLLTRALVRTVLSRYLPVLPQDWQFAADEHGRPHIVNSVPGVDDLSFNISHTREIVMLGVTKRSALGVDVEGANADTATVALADRYFSVAEAASLRALPQAAQSERFFDYWTLKESYIKARGLGLALPLQGFGFEIRGPQLSLQGSPAVQDAAARWRLWLLRPSHDHTAAVCVERTGIEPQTLVSSKIVPLAEEWPLDPIIRGQS